MRVRRTGVLRDALVGHGPVRAWVACHQAVERLSLPELTAPWLMEAAQNKASELLPQEQAA